MSKWRFRKRKYSEDRCAFKHSERKWRAFNILLIVCQGTLLLQMHVLIEQLPRCNNTLFMSLTLRQDFSYSCLDQGGKNAVVHPRRETKNLE